MSQRISVSLMIIMVLIWALPAMSTDIYLPSMPAMAAYFHVKLSIIQYTVFFYTIGFSVGALFFGPVSDRIGRRPVILISMFLAIFSTFTAMVSGELYLLFIARFLQGVAMVGLGSTMRAVIRDICPDIKTMAKFGAVLGIAIPIASALAPVIGGYIEKYLYWRLSFAFILVYLLIFVVYLLKELPETNHNKLERPLRYLFNDYSHVLLNRDFFRYNLITAFAICSLLGYLTISPYLLQVKVGLSPEQFGYTNLLISITLIASSYLNTKMIYRRSIDRLLRIGVVFLGIAGALFFVFGMFDIHNLYSILCPLVIMIIGCGFISPNASAGGLGIFTKNAGTAGSVYSCVQMLGGSAGSGFITLVSHHFSDYMEPLMGLGGLIIILAVIGLIFTNQLIHRSRVSID